MYIPSLFSTDPNGCPNGFNGYTLTNYSYTNLNTGARGRQVTNWNEYTNEVRGENYLGSGSYSSAELANGASVVFNGLAPKASNTLYANFGSQGNLIPNYDVTGSNGQVINYCYDCSRKYRWTFGSKAGLPAPWPAFATPLTLAVLLNPTGSPSINASYTTKSLNFAAGTEQSFEGFGPVWEWDAPGSGNSPAYYIISREDITPRYYYIQNCATPAITASIALSGSLTLNVGNVFQSSTSTLSGSCWSVSSSFQSGAFTPTYSNVTTASTFTDCTECLDISASKYSIVNCQTSASYIATFNSAVSIGTTFKINTPFNCFTIQSLASYSASVDYSNVAFDTFANCTECIASSGSISASLLVVAGGGAGGGTYGGGGGAGQYQSTSTTFTTGNTYAVVVGNGGTGGTNGASSSFNGIISIGGGAGGTFVFGNPSLLPGSTGASGGGGSYISSSAGGTGTAGTNGGVGSDGVGSANYSGGGGGAAEAGKDGTDTSNGGAGFAWIDGNPYAGGGGGFRQQTFVANGLGGAGGGGNGEIYSPSIQYRAATAGTANTGGGGGGGYNGGGANGGSGIVKIRYTGNTPAGTGGIITSGSGYITHTFNSSSNLIV